MLKTRKSWVAVGCVAAVAALGWAAYLAVARDPGYTPFGQLVLSEQEEREVRREDKRLQQEFNRRLPQEWRCSSVLYRRQCRYANATIDKTGGLGCEISLEYRPDDRLGQSWFVAVQTHQYAEAWKRTGDKPDSGCVEFVTDRDGKSVLSEYHRPDDKLEWQNRMRAVALDLVAKARDSGLN